MNVDAPSLKKARTKLIGNKVYLYNEIGSTNDEAKRLARFGIGEGAVVVAEEQTKGRGKPGRDWFSPGSGGIYLSIIIQPFKFQNKISIITLLGTIAATRAVRGFTHLDAKVKWPNDITVAGKKLGGVLTEACRSKSGRKALVIGIGINVNMARKDFPEALRESATSISNELGEKISRTKLTRLILEEFENLYFALLKDREDAIHDEWKILSDTIGKKIAFRSHHRVYEGKATGIGPDGELILKTFDGRIKRFVSGEILSFGEQANAS